MNYYVPGDMYPRMPNSIALVAVYFVPNSERT
jgi:hypothetical protein